MDGRLRRTLRMLFTRPGRLTEAWIAGQRTQYTPPLKLYLAASLLFFGVFKLTGFQPVSRVFLDLPDAGDLGELGEVDPRILEVATLATAADAFGSALEVFLSLLLVSVVPVTAFALFLLLYRMRRWYYVDHLVHALHVASAALLLGCLASPASAYGGPWIAGGISLAGLGVVLTYSLISIARVYGLGPLRSTLLLPGVIALGGFGGSVVYDLTAADWASTRVAASYEAYEDAYRAYGERTYRFLVSRADGQPGTELQHDRVVFRLAPGPFRRFDSHFVSDFAHLRLIAEDGVGALAILGDPQDWREELSSDPDIWGALMVGRVQLGDSASARNAAHRFAAFDDVVTFVRHPERRLWYRQVATTLLEAPAEVH